MSFLDNLEDNLKSLEAGNEGELVGREQQHKQTERARQLAVEPWAEQLRVSAFTRELLSCAVREGHRLRTKIYISWLGSTLRLEAREKRLELRPAHDGVEAIFSTPGAESTSKKLDLKGSPEELIQSWLGE